MFRSFRAAFCAILAVIALLLVAVSAAGAQGNLDCNDFNSRADAQANLDANPSDPNGLDRNDDGQACENFVYSGGSSAVPAPESGASVEAVATTGESDPDADGFGDLDCADFATQEAAQAEYATGTPMPARSFSATSATRSRASRISAGRSRARLTRSVPAA